MRYLLILLSITLFAGDPPLPPDVQKIVDAREVEVTKAKAIYDAAVVKSTAAATKQMEAVVKTKTQKGDLEGALAAKGVIDGWEKKEVGVAKPQRILNAQIAEKTLMWKGKYPVTLKADGTTINQWNEPWTWKIVDSDVCISVVNTQSKEYIFKNNGKDFFECEGFGFIK